MRLAFIKTSSMGDVIHALPVVSDVVGALPQARIEWIVEEAFADLPALHPKVAAVVPVGIRRWRSSLASRATRTEIRALRERLADEPYDLVLDLQGLFKSAWLAKMTRGPRAGFSFRCAREPLATLFYDRRYDVDMTVHAIERLRQLAAQALGYAPEGPPRFDLVVPGRELAAMPERPYAVLLHASSRAEKRWRDANWRALIRSLADAGLCCVLPWGNEAEREQAQALAAGDGGARVLPRLSLGDCALLLSRARCAVGVDTGLTHLSAALDTPTVALFSATPSWRYGPYWTPRATALGHEGAWPTPADVMQALEAVGGLAREPVA